MAKKWKIILIVVGALVIRLTILNQSLWLDEAAQALMSSQPVRSIWLNRISDFHPPLFYYLASIWMKIGILDMWLRLLPVIFGIANIYVLYLLANKLFGEKVALLSSLILSISPFHVYYSHEFRSYSLLSLLATISTYLLVKEKFILLGAINALLLYTHYSSVFYLIAQVIYVIFYQRKILKKYLLSLIFSILLYLPWIPQFINQLNAGINIDNYLPGWRNVLSLSPFKALPLTLFKLIAGRIDIIPDKIYILYIAFVLLFTLASLLLINSKKTFIYTFTFIPILLMIAISFVLPQSQPFRVIYILPFLSIAIAQSIVRFPKTFGLICLYILIFGNVMYLTRPRLQREQWRQAGVYLKSTALPVIVKFPEPFAPLRWYQPDINYISAVTSFPGNESQVSEVFENKLSSDKIVLVSYLSPLTDPDLAVESQLKKRNFKPQKIVDFPGVGFLTTYYK